jgi:hypothetical protein|tara:strand:+ start:1517 stop:1780 length:264 start_codon:yes stop_codon:yes gene_type:complete
MTSQPVVRRSSRITKAPERMKPTEHVCMDDFDEDEHDTDSDVSDEDLCESETDEDLCDESDEDDEGNLKGFIVDDDDDDTTDEDCEA